MAAVIEYCIISYTNLRRLFWIDSGVLYLDCWHSLRCECNHQFCVTDETIPPLPPRYCSTSFVGRTECGTWWPIRMQGQTVNPDMIVSTNPQISTSSWKRQFLWSPPLSEQCSYMYTTWNQSCLLISVSFELRYFLSFLLSLLSRLYNPSPSFNSSLSFFMFLLYLLLTPSYNFHRPFPILFILFFFLQYRFCSVFPHLCSESCPTEFRLSYSAFHLLLPYTCFSAFSFHSFLVSVSSLSLFSLPFISALSSQLRIQCLWETQKRHRNPVLKLLFHHVLEVHRLLVWMRSN
jgi:hypothetical protein